MTDNSFAGPMSMVKIDGAKIKLLREQQGLTQLYLATAVEVTTDTISRWENRRYPSIKRDNGLKLAEALNVSLEDLLETGTDEDAASDLSAPAPPAATDKEKTPKTGFRKNRVLLLVVMAAVCGLLGGLAWYFLFPSSTGPFVAKRILPPHCISGQPFPVLIEVSGAPDTATALIIKETLPESATIQATSPKVAAGGLKNNQIKWLKKIDGSALFVYTVSVTGKEGEKVQFGGTAAISTDAESMIKGDSAIDISRYHWADTNEDNIISDDEILAVYDRYSEIKDIDLDIDLIEELWLGSEYRWDAATSSFKIID